VREFRTDSNMRVADPRTKMDLMTAPFRVGARIGASSEAATLGRVSVSVEVDRVSIALFN
jgi:hypothetical protein